MEYEAKLTQEYWDIIARGLQEMPFRISAPVINEINRQFLKQIKDQEADLEGVVAAEAKE